MNGFAAFLSPSDGALSWGAVPASLRLDVQWYRSDVRGGPSAAEIEVVGGEADLRQISNWLRRPVEIRNAAGTLVWWGFVEEVRRTQGILTAGLSLEKLCNAISVVYSTSDGAGGSEQVISDWTTDATSIARFGRRERRYSAGEASAADVAAMLASTLATAKHPEKSSSLADLGAGAKPTGAAKGLLVCRGWWTTLDWRLFARAEGRFEYDGTAGVTASIGWHLVTDRLGFTNGVMDSVDGYLHGLYAGAQFTIAGSGANVGVRTVVQGTTTEAKIFSASNVTFELSDDVLAGDALPSVTGNALIEISDTAFNNGIWLVDGTSSDRFTVAGAGIWSEAEGTATFKQGHQVKLNATAQEFPNRTPISVKTLTITGQALAQSFVPDESVTVNRIALKIGRHGMPADNLQVAIHAAGAGIPGSALVSAAVTPGTLTTSAEWKWIDLPSLAVTAGTTYWIVVTRTGALAADNFFKVGLVTPVTGSILGWNASAWVALPAAQSIAYKVWAGEDTTAQIARIVDDASEFVGSTSIAAASGVIGNPYREGNMTAGAEIEKLLDLGTAAGDRLLAEITDGRTLSLYAEPAPSDGDLVVRSDGIIAHAAGGAYEPGVLPYGRWVTIEGADHNAGDPLSESPIFIDEAEYDVGQQRYRLMPRRTTSYAGQ